MAIRIKSKWHRSKRSERNRLGSSKVKSVEDLASVVGFNIWKIAHEVFRNLEKEGFRFAEDLQVIDFLTEFLAFLVHSTDRLMFGHFTETERSSFIHKMAEHLATTLQGNQVDLMGPGNYTEPFVTVLNSRFDEYSECAFPDNSPGFDMLRILARHCTKIMHATDSKWITEQVIEIDGPGSFEKTKKLVGEVLGIRTNTNPNT